jgi:hypothetical protein
VAWFAYFLCRLLLPRALAINDATAARGGQRLRAEFDFFDAVLLEQQANAAQAAQQDGNKDAPAGGCLPYYLTGSKLSAAGELLAAVPASLVSRRSAGRAACTCLDARAAAPPSPSCAAYMWLCTPRCRRQPRLPGWRAAVCAA